MVNRNSSKVAGNGGGENRGMNQVEFNDTEVRMEHGGQRSPGWWEARGVCWRGGYMGR